MVTSVELQDTQDPLSELTCCLNPQTLLDLARRFSETYKYLAITSTEQFLVTPVTALPTGKEKGKFLAIDVGGSNLRVGFVELLGDLGEAEDCELDIRDDVAAKIKRRHEKSWPIGDHLKMDKPEDLFQWVGDCMAEVVQEAVSDSFVAKDQEILLGVTFSFPMAQTTLSEATLLPMGKGFAITTNLNLGEMLLTGYSRHCSSFTTRNTSTNHSPKPQSHTQLPKLRVAAITNDTVATFVSLAYTVKATPNSRVVMGLIVGTGTNATVPMTPTALHPTKRNHLSSLGDTDTVVINTEWTIRGTDKPLDALGLKTKWDRILDEQSEAPGFQPFEYMTSGRYLGEIVRLAFTDIAGTDDTPPSLHCRNSLPTQFLSEVVARSDEPTLLHQLQTTYPSTSGFWSPQRTQLLRAIAQAVQRRSSALIAAACIGLLDCVGEVRLDGDAATHKEDRDGAASHEQPDVEELVIAYTGSTISQYPHWLDDCQKWINELVGALGVNVGKAVVLREVREGGVIGAGVLAGMGDRIV